MSNHKIVQTNTRPEGYMLAESLKTFHDKVYVITIAAAEDRQRSAVEQLGEATFEFVFSIDKSDVSKESLIANGTYDETLAVRSDPKGRTMTLGHICCSIGHRSAYQKMLEDGCERALIFEDDVVTLPVDDAEIERILTNVPANAELIQWGWNGGRFRPPLGHLQEALFHVRRAFGRYPLSHRMIRNLYMRRYNDHFHVASVNFLSHAYTITKSAAETFIRWNTPIRLNADHLFIHAALAGEVRAYVSKVQLFGQRSIDPNDPLESLTQKYY